jgi:hypothetical protein
MFLAGDDAIYRTIPATAADAPVVFAIPIAGGASTKLFTLGAADSVTAAGLVVAHWGNVANGAGTLDVWTRTNGLKAGIATGSDVGFVRASDDGTRIAFSQDATIADGKPATTSIGVRDYTGAVNLTTLSGANYAADLVASACPLQMSFAGKTFIAEYCTGATTSATNARLVVVPATGNTPVRLDAATDAADGTLTGNIRFSADATGAKVVAGNPAKLWTIASPSTPLDLIVAEAAVQYQLLPSGNALVWRTSANEIKYGVITGSTVQPTLAATGALTMVFSPDDHAVMFTKLPKDPTTSLVDVNVVDVTATTPTAVALIPTATGEPIGFTATNTTALFLDGANTSDIHLKSAPIAGGAVLDLGRGTTGGRAAQSGDDFVFVANAHSGGVGQPTFGDIYFVDAATGGTPLKISSDVPVGGGDNEFFISGKNVVYTRVAFNDTAIYTAVLP